MLNIHVLFLVCRFQSHNYNGFASKGDPRFLRYTSRQFTSISLPHPVHSRFSKYSFQLLKSAYFSRQLQLSHIILYRQGLKQTFPHSCSEPEKMATGINSVNNPSTCNLLIFLMFIGYNFLTFKFKCRVKLLTAN